MNNFYFGSKPISQENKIMHMKDMYRLCRIKDQEERRKKITEIKDQKANGQIDSSEEEYLTS